MKSKATTCNIYIYGFSFVSVGSNQFPPYGHGELFELLLRKVREFQNALNTLFL